MHARTKSAGVRALVADVLDDVVREPVVVAAAGPAVLLGQGRVAHRRRAAAEDCVVRRPADAVPDEAIADPAPPYPRLVCGEFGGLARRRPHHENDEDLRVQVRFHSAKWLSVHPLTTFCNRDALQG